MQKMREARRSARRIETTLLPLLGIAAVVFMIVEATSQEEESCPEGQQRATVNGFEDCWVACGKESPSSCASTCPNKTDGVCSAGICICPPAFQEMP